jgi:hypothetical protein
MIRSLDESFSLPLFLIFRNLCMTPDSDASRQPLLSLVAEMRQLRSNIAYLLLYFMKSGRRDTGDDDVAAYADLCQVMDQTVQDQLVLDLQVPFFNQFSLISPIVSNANWTIIACSRFSYRMFMRNSRPTRWRVRR